MMNRFKAGNYGAPTPARGIGVPMDADANSLGRVTYYGPMAFGPNIPQQVAAHTYPRPPRYADRVVTGGNMPPEVIPGGGVVGPLQRALRRFRGGG